MEIIVCNSRIVSKYLGFEVKTFENLMENPKCKNFIETNSKYFNSTEPTDFIEFYNKTGIILEHMFIKSGSMGFNAYGIKQNKIHIAHIMIIDRENKSNIIDGILYVNDKKIRCVKQEIKEQEHRFTKFQELNKKLEGIFSNNEIFEDRKEELILYDENYFEYYNKIKKIDQLIITPYNDIFALTREGKLYCNGEIYSENVEYVFEENTINKIIIYKDNNIEYLTANFGGPLNKKCDKVLYNEEFLATLENKEMQIIIKNSKEYIENKSYTITLKGIDDIDFNELDDEELILTIGKEKINFPIMESSIDILE